MADTDRRWQPHLDGLRALAALAVTAFHLYLPYVLPGGYVGVDVFFVLSGYLITGLLLQEHDRYGDISLRHFYIRRALRLFPALILVVVFSVAAFGLFDPPGEAPYSETLTGAAGGLLYVSCWLAAVGVDMADLGHTWSLSVEEHFYLVWPFVIAGVLRRARDRAHVWIAAALAVSLAHRLLVLPLLGATASWQIYAPDARAEQLLFGCALAAWLDARRRAGRPISWETGWLAAGGAALLVVASMVVTRAQAHLVGFSTSTALASAALLLHLHVHPDGRVARALSIGPLVWLGKRSYAIYLWHVPVIGLTAFPVDTKEGILAKLLLRGLLIVGAAAASYRWLELPMLELKGRLGHRQGAVAPAPR